MIDKLINTIFVSPSKGFSSIKYDEIGLSKKLFFLLLLMLLVVSSFVFAGVFFVQELPLEVALRYSGFSFLSWLSSILPSVWAINNLIAGFKGGKNFSHIFYLVMVSVTFLLLFSALSYLFPERNKVLIGFSFAGVFYYYIGLLELTSISKERITGFLLISLLVFSLIVFLSQMFWGLIFKIPIQL